MDPGDHGLTPLQGIWSTGVWHGNGASSPGQIRWRRGTRTSDSAACGGAVRSRRARRWAVLKFLNSLTVAGICKAPGSVNRLTEAIPLKARLTITFRQKQLKKSPPLIFLPALVKIVVVVWRQDQMCKPFDHSSRYFGFFSGIVGFCCFVSVFFSCCRCCTELGGWPVCQSSGEYSLVLVIM